MAKKEKAPVNIGEKELADIAACTRSPFEFSKHIYVVHPVRGKTRFELYQFQIAVLYQFLLNRFNIVLKFRQAGITELISMYCLWLCLFHSNKRVQILSIKDSVAKKVLKKIKYMYKNLPVHLQLPIINGKSENSYGNVSSIEFSNGSWIESLPSSEDAGRSEGLSLLVLDEAAMIRWASTIWASAMPTLSTGGSAIINSTPLGLGTWYHSTWLDAISGNSPINAIRLRWTMHPERGINWYNEMYKVLGPKRTAQEIDGDFLGSGNTVFDPVDIKAIEEGLWEFPILSQRFNGQYRRFSDYDSSLNYFIGADVATGRSTDYSAFTVADSLGEDHAVYKGRIPINKFGKLLGEEGKKFGWATIAPETNDIGIAVTSYLQDEGYPKLYYTRKILKQKGKNKPKVAEVPGWLTTSKNRSMIIENLEKDIREDNVIIKDPFFLHEAPTFIYDAAGRPVAMGKHKAVSVVDMDMDGETYADDSILAKAITNHIRKTPQRNTVIAPQ